MLSLPTFYLKLSLNHLPSSLFPQIFLKSLHYRDSFPLEHSCTKFLQDPYLETITFFHNPFSSYPNLPFRLARSVLLKLKISLNPSPTLDLLLYKEFYLT